jgi:signal transduction histidine kinase
MSTTGTVTRELLAEMVATTELLASRETLGAILDGLASYALRVAHADYAAISTFGDDGKLVRFIYAGISDENAQRLGVPPVGKGLLGELAHHDKPIRLADLTEHPASSGWPDGHPDMAAFLGVPMRVAGRTIGSFYLTRARGKPPFTEDDELAAVMLSLQAAVSVAAASAHERSDRTSLLEERGRIAHDLHDGTIQSLYGLGLGFGALSARDDFPEEATAAMREAVTRINELIGDIRGYITMLEAASPAAPPELSRDLAFVVRTIVPAGIDTVLNTTAAALQELTPRESEDLLYIAREALSNAIRHGEPTRVAIDLRQTAASTALTVQDNGIGFDAEAVRTGLGTVTMRTRAERLNAQLSIVGIPGMGTTVRVAIPRKRANQEPESGADHPTGRRS